jgi:phospholipase/carboxylesterase
MSDKITGIHHITAIAADAKRNLDFYTRVLGLRMVKRTVNFDDPGTYHFYYGNERGTPGTILTFFPWEGIAGGRTGTGMATEIGYSVNKDSLLFWADRLGQLQVSKGAMAERMGEVFLPFRDPDGLNISLIGTNDADERQPRGTPEVPEGLTEADRALILVHGRGSTAADILSLADYLPVEDFALLAPQATGRSWYPYSFLEPPVRNQPWLGSALELLATVVEDVLAAGIREERIFFAGLSQGACLTLEFVTRHAARYGGVAAFTGGLIGDRIYKENYKGDFAGTPFFIGTGDRDPHVPVERVDATAVLLREMGAVATEKVYPGRSHTIVEDELAKAGRIVFG